MYKNNLIMDELAKAIEDSLILQDYDNVDKNVHLTAQEVKIMQSQMQDALKVKSEYLEICYNPNLVYKWFIKVKCLDGPFKGGEYLCQMIAPFSSKDDTRRFPYVPPVFYFLTPNGVYKPKSPICINIGHYHSDQYRATLKMVGFAEQLVAGMLQYKDISGGVNVESTDDATKAKLAAESVAYNKKYYPEILALLDQFEARIREKKAKKVTP